MRAGTTGIGIPLATGVRPPSRSSATAGSRAVHRDPRWPRIVAAIDELRALHRRSIRIVDSDCACGTLLIEAALYARALGFTAIEGQGIDGAPASIGRARAAAARFRDPAIGLAFEVVDMAEGLGREAAFPADIVLFPGRFHDEGRSRLLELLAAAGDLLIGYPASTVIGERFE